MVFRLSIFKLDNSHLSEALHVIFGVLKVITQHGLDLGGGSK